MTAFSFQTVPSLKFGEPSAEALAALLVLSLYMVLSVSSVYFLYQLLIQHQALVANLLARQLFLSGYLVQALWFGIYLNS